MPTSEELRMLQALPLELKVARTEQRIREWVDWWGKDHVYVSFSGGKDSTVLLHIVREMYGDEIPAVFVNTGLEYPEIQRAVRSYPNVVILTPEMNFREVLSQYGYPVISKEVSNCIEATRRWCSKNLNVERERERASDRRRIEDSTPEENRCRETSRSCSRSENTPKRVQQMFGTGKYRADVPYHVRHVYGLAEFGGGTDVEPSCRMTSSNYWESVRTAAENGDAVRWVEKMFGVRRAGPKLIKGNIPNKSRFSQIKYVPLLDADFLISPKCCDIMKKKSFHKFQKENEMHPMIGTMAEESLLRASAWMKNGCNAFTSTGNSTPMAFWKEQDVLKYIADNGLKIPSVYGEIIPDEEHEQISMLHNFEGRLRCTGVSRTGCMYCPFGAGRESVKEEGRFIKLARDYPKQYAYIMNGGGYDPEDGYWKPTKEGLGFAHVFDEINRLIPTKSGKPYIRYLPDGGEMERAKALAEAKGDYVHVWGEDYLP